MGDSLWPDGREKYSRESRQEAVRLYASGLTAREASADTGIPAAYIYRLASRAGLSKGTHGTVGHPPEVREKALAMLKDRAGYLETARTLGVSDTTIAKWFPGYGLTPIEKGQRSYIMRKAKMINLDDLELRNVG